MKPHPWRTGLWAAVLLVGLGGLWFSFAPKNAGGQAAYVIVAGASMEPALHRGDLVIARQSGEYQVGDIVAYRHPMVGPVIHRILAEVDGRYTLKGDANAWTDSYQPSVGDVLGAAWIRVPGAGKLLLQLRQPGLLSLLALVVSVLLVTTVIPMKRSSPSAHSPSPGVQGVPAVARDAGVLQVLIFVLGLISLLAFLLAVPAWGRPLLRLGTRTLDYTHSGAFDYGARVAAGVYDSGTLQTGDPVYLRLNRTVSLRFDYAFGAEAPANVQGTTSLRAEIRDVNGWHRSIVLQPPKPFGGTEAMAFGVLDLNQARKYVADLETLTGVIRPAYTLVVIPEIQVGGTLAGQPIQDVFAPTLAFQLDSLQLQMVRQDPAPPEADPLQPSAARSVEYSVSEANQIKLLGASLDVRIARWVSGLGLALGLGGLAVLAWLVGRAQRRDPDVAASMKFGAQLVEVEAGTFEANVGDLGVASLDDLARVAARAGTMIHRVRSESGSQYFVQDGDRLYHLAAKPAAESEG